jgi:hypothetical protein
VCGGQERIDRLLMNITSPREGKLFAMMMGFASSTHPAGREVSAVVPLSITAIGFVHILAITNAASSSR